MIDYTYLENVLIPARFFTMISEIDTENVRLIEKRSQMEQVALDAKRSAEIMTRKKVFTYGLREKGFGGFYKASEFSMEQAGETTFTADFVIELHKRIMTDKEKGGVYRKEEWNEELRKVYPVKPEYIDGVLHEICNAYQTSAENKNIHPVLLISSVLQDLIQLAPFEQGNQLLVELVARYLFLDCGYEIVRFRPCRLEASDAEVLRVMQEAEEDFEAKKDVVPFMEHILFQLRDSYRREETRMIAAKEKRFLKKERIEAVIMGSSAPINKAEICERLPDISETTIEAQLAVMCKKGQIVRLGSRRDSVYIKKEVEE